MINDSFLFCNDITTANINSVFKEQSLLEERRVCEFSEVAGAAARYALSMLSDGYGIYEVLSLVSEELSDAFSKLHVSSELSADFDVSAYFKMVSSKDKVLFTKLFFEYLNSYGVLLSEENFLQTSSGNETFIYVKNALADEAFDVFSQDFLNPRLAYAPSLVESARAVSLGEAEYALLPFEERGGARLSTVAEILFKNDLKINSVTPVFGFEGNADMKYALVSKHFSVPDVQTDDDRYLEIRLRSDSLSPLHELFSAADIFGSSLYRVNTISFATDDGIVPYFSVVFKDEGRDFSLLLTYLTLFYGGYTPIGLYKNLE